MQQEEPMSLEVTPSTSNVFPGQGLKNKSQNCWLNSSVQSACNVGFLREAILNLKDETSNEANRSSWKTHALVVLGYLLIGFGIALAASVFYISFVASPIVAVCSPIVPIALGVLLIQYQESKGVGFQPLIDVIENYQNERQLAIVGAVSSIDTQKVREWLYQATFNQNIPAEDQRITSPSATKQEDPIEFFRFVLEKTNFRMPAIHRTRIDAGVRNPPLVELPESILKLDLIQNEEIVNPDGTILIPTIQEIIESNFITTLDDLPDTTIEKRFQSPPEHLVIHLERTACDRDEQNNIKFDENGNIIKKKLTTRLANLSQFIAPEQCFGKDVEYKTHAFITHSPNGNSINSGHYIAYAQDKGGNWWVFNDSSSRIITEEVAHAQMRSAYVAFTSKVEPTSTK